MGLSFASCTLSFKDVPGKTALVVFLKGCNFRCRHCHNWRLVLGKGVPTIDEEMLLFEISHNPTLEVLVISGGEPTVSDTGELSGFIEKVKKLRPDVGIRIDTNGSKPERLKELSPLVDGFAVDIKAPLSNPEAYRYTAGVEVDTEKILQSLRIADGMPLTIYRTPKYPWLSEEDLEEIRRSVLRLSSPWFLNEFFQVPDCPFSRPLPFSPPF